MKTDLRKIRIVFFTAIVSLLIKYTETPGGAFALDYGMDILNELSIHTDNAITTLQHGTQN